MAKNPSEKANKPLAAVEPANPPATVNPVEEPARNSQPAAPADAAGGTVANGHAAEAAKSAGDSREANSAQDGQSDLRSS